ncbi:hypothetical protein [Treponema pedis]|uniref:Uncharacterized protein n=1 Tax=Treponema pedis str. T A4 TaxID=1291379 RepID=S6A3Q2_9SPIR|nr:hypothetical protein [Treponema pedis]AGT43776.1 hypothetical protein TPE_1281 [Treponema pedis str. T A4]QSI04536.1 hypothetical protein DYQ05_06105 [Treponema pedis]
MPNTFNKWKSIYDAEDLISFSEDKEALLWLKVKSIVRKEIIKEFCFANKIVLNETSLSKQFEELFNLLSSNIKDSHKKLDKYILFKNEKILNDLNQEKLVSELYKLQNFEWGGDYQNSLDKYLVSHYVKTIQSYDELTSKFDNEIKHAVQGYVLNSWYNHWSSILIEHIFKSHEIVLPTVGQIKSVDFFVNQIPCDLKVTYFPAEFLKEQRKINGYPVELTYLKSKAKELGISFDKDAKPSEIHYEISEKLKDRNSKESLEVLNSIKRENLGIVKDCIKNPKLLAKWLYENQGEMRFGSENRLFLVLIDTDDFSASWKLKRNLDLLKPAIHGYLDNFGNKSLNDMKIEFTYQGKSKVYKTYADVIFVMK